MKVATKATIITKRLKTSYNDEEGGNEASDNEYANNAGNENLDEEGEGLNNAAGIQ